MWTESRRSPGTFWQLVLAVRHGLTGRLHALCLPIEFIKANVEVRLEGRKWLFPLSLSSARTSPPKTN
jgi:hypothetical protein